MTPFEYMRARNSKRSVESEKTFSAAFRKVSKTHTHIYVNVNM